MMRGDVRAGSARDGWWRVGVAVCLLSLGGLAACESSVGPADGPGQFTVLLTDAPFPFDLVDEANVTISRVEVAGEGGVQVLAEGEQTFNLLDLQNGVTAALGTVEMPEGRVSQVRLIVSEASILLVDDDPSDGEPAQEYDLFVPSGAQTGIKILVAADIDSGMETTATLDFDVEDSFIVQGNPETPAGIEGFLFKPVIKVAGVTQAQTQTAAEDNEEEDGESQEEAQEEEGADSEEEEGESTDDGDASA